MGSADVGCGASSRAAEQLRCWRASESRWYVLVTGPARRQIDRLPISVAAAVIETLDAIVSSPRRLGKPLRFGLEGCFSARRGPYRIYRIDDANHTISVLAVAHRADIYRPR